MIIKNVRLICTLICFPLGLHRREIITVRGQSYFSRLPIYWPPIPLSARRVCPPPATKAGGTQSPGGEGDGGSIFWKTREIGLPSYSNNLSTVYIVHRKDGSLHLCIICISHAPKVTSVCTVPACNPHMEAHEGLMGEIYDVFPFPPTYGRQANNQRYMHLYSVHTDRGDRELDRVGR